MRIPIAPLLLAVTLGAGSAVAADPPAAPQGPGMGPGVMGRGMMGSAMVRGGMMDMGAMQCMDQSDARLAAVKADLKLTPAQIPLWNAVVEAEKANAQLMRRGMGAMMRDPGAGQGAQRPGPGRMMGYGPLPERLERHERVMAAHLDALRKVMGAVSPFYAALTPEQKAVADRSLCGSMPARGAGSAMMGRRPN